MGKKLHAQLTEIKAAHPAAAVQLWAMDEHRLGLHPILRRVWVDKWLGSLSAPVHCRYDWFWLYGFVHPCSGQTYWWLLPRVNIDLFNRALADFAQHFDLGPHRQVLLVMDQAGWHTSEQVVVPEGLHLAFLPPTLPICNRQSDSGSFSMKPLQTAFLTPSMTSSTGSSSAVDNFSTSPT